MIASLTLVFLATFVPAFAYPGISPEDRSQKGVPIAAPPKQSNLDVLSIPDPAHPFRHPGPKDVRGPCPGLNTLANHGYIPRNGIASFEEIVTATGHAFSMDYDFASGLAAFGILARGNAYINKLSIGLQSPQVPSLPGKIDGPVARGLGAHGRFEGDVSMTRLDAAIGDNLNFNSGLYRQLLDFVAQYGDNSTTTGPHSIVNTRAMQAFKYKRFMDDQATDKKLEYHILRFSASYAEASFALNFFANGTDGLLSVPTMTSFFRDQRFPKNWHRNQGGASFLERIGKVASEIFEAHPVVPGANNADGVFVPDAGPFDGCSFYNYMMENSLPAVLLNTTGLLRQNVDFLLGAIHNVFPECPVALPGGASNV